MGMGYKIHKIKEEINNRDGTATITLSDFMEPMFYTDCLICGKSVPCNLYSSGVQICDECKQAMAWVKEKMNEKDNG